VVLSLGYARDHRGVLPTDLGILTTDRGAAALAQALVSGTSRVTVLTALAPHHLAHVASGHDGAAGVVALAELVESAKKPPVPSERSAPGPSDWLLADVARLLRAEGLAVRLRYGVGGQAIPLVVGDTRDRGYSVAVVTDELPAGPRGSVRDRMRWHYRHLEALGWTVVPLWTVDVFMDPVGAAAQVKRALRGEDDDTVLFDDAVLDDDSPEEAREGTDEAPEGEPASSTEDAVAAEDSVEATPEVAPPRTGSDRPLIPTRAWEDEDAAWGDGDSSSRDEEIKRDRPPHW